MLADDALRTKSTLYGQRVVLRPLGPEHTDVFWRSLHDPEVRRLTGTHAEFQRDQIDAWLASRSDHSDRLDLAIHRRHDDVYLGELALIELDPANESAGVRIALTSTAIAGRGYGSDAMRTLLAHAFDTVGLHRIHLDVFAFNTHAIRTYERLGFTHEGRAREALLWDGVRHDALQMSMLRPEWEAAHARHPNQPARRRNDGAAPADPQQAPDEDEEQPC
jgi:RimJ/RimL family protein N-acetyltransferase